jgi:DNA polymerase (family 10)
MDNRDIASILREIALYQELGGENPFKFRAFDQASRNIERLSENIETVAREDRLGEIRGIGKSIGEIIKEVIQTGSSSLLGELKSSFPDGLRDLLAIPGLGPKKVRSVWKNLGVTTLGELEYACKENRLITLEGFGFKSQEKILKGIEFMKQYSSQYLYSEALDIATAVVDTLRDSALFRHIEIAGSLRRGKNTFKDIDILLVPLAESDPVRVKQTLMGLADSQGDVEGIIGAGDTKVSIRRKGLQVDFRIVGEEAFPAALQHFTGSKEHNTLLRTRAKGLGMKMNEYGVFKGEETLPLGSEKDVYRAIGLEWIPPEIREADGEVEASERGNLPKLVCEEDFKGMIHIHSNYSDGVNTLEQLARECMRRGYTFLCISDHSRSAFYAGGLSIEALEEQRVEAERLNAEVSPFRIFCGVESDILADGSLDYPDEVLERLDFVIGSIHSRMNMNRDEATERLIRAVKNPHLTILGHPSGRLLLSREGYPFDEDKLYRALAEEGVVLEHNCNPYRLDPDWQSLRRAGEMAIVISIDPDAHSIEGFDDMRFGITMARKAWLGPQNLLNCMKPEEVDEFFRERKTRSLS